MKVQGNYIRKSYDENMNMEITFLIKDYNSKKAVEELEKETPYSIEIKKVRSKRSLNQNAFFWKIVSMIAENMEQDPMDIYIYLLEETQAKYEYVMGLETIENELKKNFRAVKVVRPQEFQGKKMIVYKCFIGSSKLSVDEMKLLIDKALEYCSELDIQVDEDGYL